MNTQHWAEKMRTFFCKQDTLAPFSNGARASFFIACSWVLIAAGIISHFFLYWYPKNLWLDEAMLAKSIYAIPFGEIFGKPLPDMQSAPLGFLVLAKLSSLAFGVTERGLCLPSFLAFCLLLCFAYRLCSRNFSPVICFLFIATLIGNSVLARYSVEFKPYIFDALIAVILIYACLNIREIKWLCLIACLCLLFSTASVFFLFGFGCVIFIREIKAHHFIFFFHKNWMSLGAALAFVGIYSFLYLRIQAVPGFYVFWQKHFIPHDLTQLPQFYQQFVTPILREMSSAGIQPLRLPVILGCVLWGGGVLYRSHNELFWALALSFSSFIAASLLGQYPVEMRLCLFLFPCFLFLFSCGLSDLCRHVVYWLRTRYVAVLVFIFIFALGFKHVDASIRFAKKGYPTEQIVSSIEYLNSILPNGKHELYVFRPTMPAYEYYQHLNQKSLPLLVFFPDDAMVENMDLTFSRASIEGIYFLFSHAAKTEEEKFFDLLGIRYQSKIMIQEAGVTLYFVTKKEVP